MTPEQQAEQDKLPSLQYKVICGPAFERNSEEHKAIQTKLDLLLDRQAKVKEDLAVTKSTTVSLQRSTHNQFKWLWLIMGALGTIVGMLGSFLWDHATK